MVVVPDDVMAVENPGEALTSEQLAVFERDGFLVVSGVLDGGQIAEVTSVVDGLYERCRRTGLLGEGGALHRLGAVGACPELAWLVDHPRVLGPVWSILGWNLHVYHSHVDVHPQVAGQRPFRFEWHQDGGRQNRELESEPRPRLSVKAVYWLSDVSRGGRGNLRLVPGSHRTNWIEGPPRRDMAWPDPEGAVEVRVRSGEPDLLEVDGGQSRPDGCRPASPVTGVPRLAGGALTQLEEGHARDASKPPGRAACGAHYPFAQDGRKGNDQKRGQDVLVTSYSTRRPEGDLRDDLAGFPLRNSRHHPVTCGDAVGEPRTRTRRQTVR